MLFSLDSSLAADMCLQGSGLPLSLVVFEGTKCGYPVAGFISGAAVLLDDLLDARLSDCMLRFTD